MKCIILPWNIITNVMIVLNGYVDIVAIINNLFDNRGNKMRRFKSLSFNDGVFNNFNNKALNTI